MTVRQAASRPARKAIVSAARDLRQRQTPSERLLWDALRNREQLGRKFRRQARIGHFVVDFYCTAERLVIEVDGGIHRQRQAGDRNRQSMLEETGLRVLRVTAEGCEEDLDSVLRRIRTEFRTSPPSPRPAGHPSPSERERGQG